MTESINKLKEFLSKSPSGSAHDNEANGLTLLIRMLALTILAYFFVLALILLIGMEFVPALVCAVSMAAMLAFLIISYSITQDTATAFLVVAQIILLTFVAVAFGEAAPIRPMLLMGIPLIFASIRYDLSTKIMWTVCILLYVVMLSVILAFSANNGGLSAPTMILVSEFTTVFSAICLTFISVYFCMKFTEAEHKIYVYNRQLKKMASLDPLTNVMNRRGMGDVLIDMQKEYHAGISGLSIALGDIDFFKKVNDQYGHDCGDYILKTISDIFAKYIEGKGEVCRWGGEEFLFAFTEKNSDNVFIFLNDLRHTIKHTRFEFNGIELRITMTFGLEEFSPNADIESTIKAADEKLYLGKESGRDKVVY